MSESKRPRKRPRKQESVNNGDDAPPDPHSSASTLRAATPTAASVNAEVERATNLVELDGLSKQKPPKHDDEFWFEDGTIILITDNVAFRVYEGLLSRDSSVFCRNYGLQSLPADGEKVGGCPVVRPSDSAEELRVLLRAMLSPWRYVVLPCSLNADVMGYVLVTLVRIRR